MNTAELETIRTELNKVRENIALLQRHGVYNLTELSNREKDLQRDCEFLEEERSKKSTEDKEKVVREGYIEKYNFFYHRAEEASIVGDTVGDPLKDTSGPSLNILIKLSSILSVVFSPLFLKTAFFGPKSEVPTK